MPRLPISLATLLLLVSAARAQHEPRQPSTDPWEVTELTNRPSLTLELPALTTARVAAFEVRPVLIVRCQARELDVFVSTGSDLDSDDKVMTPLSIQWGSAAPEAARWKRSTDSRSAFAPDARAFVRQLGSNPDVQIEIRRSDRSALSIRFNARGLDRHMAQLDAACPSGAAGPAQLYAEDQLDERPAIVSAPTPDYPPLLRRAGVQGRVTVQAVIDTLGHAEPASLKILARPHPGFEQSARAYVLHAVFRPAHVKGRVVRALIRVPVDYRIE